MLFFFPLNSFSQKDDYSDDRILEKYKEARLAELKKLAKEELYGGVLSISRDEFIKEVTESSKDCWVGVFLWGDNRESRVVEDMIKRVANKFRAMKFVSIKGNLCIDKFPDKYVT